MTHRLDINLGQGIGPIRHGMRPADVLAVFKEPQLYEKWMGGNLNDALLFHGMRLHFSKWDSRGPLAAGTLMAIVIHQREDAFLFGRLMTDWTKKTMLEQLFERGYEALTPPNGDVAVRHIMEMSFDEDERLIWLETWGPTTSNSVGGK